MVALWQIIVGKELHSFVWNRRRWNFIDFRRPQLNEWHQKIILCHKQNFKSIKCCFSRLISLDRKVYEEDMLLLDRTSSAFTGRLVTSRTEKSSTNNCLTSFYQVGCEIGERVQRTNHWNLERVIIICNWLWFFINSPTRKTTQKWTENWHLIKKERGQWKGHGSSPGSWFIAVCVFFYRILMIIMNIIIDSIVRWWIYNRLSLCLP